MNNQIKCPNCSEAFTISEASYDNIVTQIKNEQFEKELETRANEKALIVKKDVEKEIEVLKMEIKSLEEKNKLKIEISKKEIEENLNSKIQEKEKEVDHLNNLLSSVHSEKEKELLKRELSLKEEISNLTSKLEISKSEKEIEKTNLKETYEMQLKLKDDEISRISDFKAKQSTKMMGEDLEKHCEVAFNTLRMTAFPNAEFTKDNDISGGTKGDYIYRDYEDNIEIISIMFEMKNEADTTTTKKKNEDFFKKLDKDRKDKGCEYAILVSMLEQDNELYNQGIVDVSYEYEKMYVIRPQFFIPVISMLKNAAKNSAKYRKEIELIRQQNTDVSNFEENLEAFKAGFSRNYTLASTKFNNAIAEIDKSIKALEKTKSELLSSENNLRLANNKLDDVSIKKLTKNSPIMREKFEEIKV